MKIVQPALCIATLAIALTSMATNTARAQTRTSDPCVRIYYDYGIDPEYELGKVYAIMLQNLLAHFPRYQQIVEPIENYQAGDLNQCKAAFYVGSYFDNPIPDAFIRDYQTTQSSVMWMGYNIWKLGNDNLTRTLGFTYGGLTTLNKEKLDDQKMPSFYKTILYKGEKFPKFAAWNKTDPSRLDAAWEQIILKRPVLKVLKDDKKPEKGYKEVEIKNPPGQILAEAEHSKLDSKLPYAVRNGNKFYVADVPFSYMTESDRYLVFADLIFDVLNEQPRYPGKKPAVMRIEDVSSCTGEDELRLIAKVMRDKNVPFHLAMFPVYSNPTGKDGECEEDTWAPMTTKPSFQRVVQEMRNAGAAIIWHGVSHQYTDPQNPKGPKSGISGDDFEFWEENSRTPVPEDSVSWVLDRLHYGYNELERSGIRPQIWEFPHYEASALDYLIVSRLFSWHIGRFAYSNFKAFGVPPQDPSLWFEKSGMSGQAARKAAFQNMWVDYSVTKRKPFNMMYPYEAYGDIYGQRVLPENLNYVTKWGKGHDKGEAMIDDMVDNLKRNRVLRDVWASLFLHPYLLEDKKTGPLEKIIKRVQENGYEFINLDQFISDKKNMMKPPTIERELGAIN